MVLGNKLLPTFCSSCGTGAAWTCQQSTVTCAGRVLAEDRAEPCGHVQVAIKKVLQDKRFKNRELQIMKMMSHPNVVSLKHCFYSTTEKEEVRGCLPSSSYPQAGCLHECSVHTTRQQVRSSGNAQGGRCRRCQCLYHLTVLH